MSGLLDGMLRCNKHDCPMILVVEEYVCLFEYVDERIGSCRVSDVLSNAEGVALIFENGVEMPLICPCCEKAIHTSDADKLLTEMNGFCLQALECFEDSQEGKDSHVLTLCFAKGRKKKKIDLSLESVHQMTERRSLSG